MGFRFRKSIGNGIFRVNFSKSGIGYSAGVKGARVTKKSNGGTRSTVGIPGTGMSYVKEGKSSGRRITFWTAIGWLIILPFMLMYWMFVAMFKLTKLLITLAVKGIKKLIKWIKTKRAEKAASAQK